MNYTIRKARPADLEEIVQLCAEHAAYEMADYAPEGKAVKLEKMLFSKNPQLFCLLVECKNEIAGYASFSKECSTWNADYYMHLDCLFLREKFRGNGIGEALINELVIHSKETKAHHIEWQTPVFNTGAIRFYHRIGAKAKEKLRFTLTFK